MEKMIAGLAGFQTIAAWGVVILTAGLLLKRVFKKKRSSCGGGCGCSEKLPDRKSQHN